MVLNILKTFADQVIHYTTFLGKIWYVVFFILRMTVVVSLCSSVYSDEHSGFHCQTDVTPCKRVCYNEFVKVSQYRFWTFQLMAVALPLIFFHLYCTFITNNALEVGRLELELEPLKDDLVLFELNNEFKKMQLYYEKESNLQKKKEKLGSFRIKKLQTGVKLVKSFKIRRAYVVCLIFQASIEILTAFFGKIFFNIENNFPTNHATMKDYLWCTVPEQFKCGKSDFEPLNIVCSQHFWGDTNESFLPCYTSKPWEKTFFCRYLNILSIICALISILEIFYIIVPRIIQLFTRKR